MPAKVEPTPPLPGLSPVAGKPLIARFDGGQLSSDAGVLALREVERRLGVADRLAAWPPASTMHAWRDGSGTGWPTSCASAC
jgi:hypothetical protein